MNTDEENRRGGACNAMETAGSASAEAVTVRHHPSISSFSPVTAPCENGFQRDSFLGTRISRDLLEAPFRPSAGYPGFDEEYFEWIDVLESVRNARESYVMIELGAGYGRWSVRAAWAAQRCRLPYRLIAVEAEPQHFAWLQRHFRNNGIDPANHVLIHAAVTDKRGLVQFYIRSDAYVAGLWYGQSVNDKPSTPSSQQYCGFAIHDHLAGSASIRVPTVRLADLLKELNHVDLIDFDIQGEESNVIVSAIEELNAKVKRLHIGTHSAEIEGILRQVLYRNGWQCLADYPLASTSETSWGKITFGDGVQSWVNPRL